MSSCGYGVMPAGPANQIGVKSPGSFLDYTVDLAKLYPSPYLDHTDPIIGLSLSNKPAGDGELSLAFLRLHEDGSHAVWWEWAGVSGRNYQLRLKAQTRARRIHDWLIGQVCDPSLAEYPLPPAPVPGFGAPLIWSEGNPMFCPLQALPPHNTSATGTTQLTATAVPLAMILINAGPGGGISLPQASTFNGSIPWVTNVSGGPVTIYPFAGDTIAGLAVNAGAVIQDQQTAHFNVSEAGFLILS